jgi:hypothetical protein
VQPRFAGRCQRGRDVTAAVFQREMFSISRASEYFDARELQAQTGQPRYRFAAVVVKELIDNALDACETAGVVPEVEITVLHREACLVISVRDNAAGIGPETVARILDFSTRTSDKAAYRSPTRGAQGNALKTVIGIPHALGARMPILIEAQGIEHRIEARLDPAGTPRIEPTTRAVPRQPGTRVTLFLPADGQQLDAEWWAQAFSLFNPHATVRIRQSGSGSQHAQSAEADTVDSYRATARLGDDWRKWLPGDPTSPWWYLGDELRRLVFQHIAETRERGARDPLLRDFIRSFRGLTATAKAKAICDELPGMTRLSDFDGREELVDTLAQLMWGSAEPVKPGALGKVGEEHIRARIEEWYGVLPGRWWYARETGLIGDGPDEGIPYVVEMAIAETYRPGAFFSGVNFSPTFGDPLAQMVLRHDAIATYGLLGFLALCEADPRTHDARHVAVFHLICPALEFLDRGKTNLRLQDEIVDAVTRVAWKVGKALYREAKRRERDATRAERADVERRREDLPPTVTLKDAVFAVLPAAARAAGGGTLPFSKRQFYYQVRRMIQAYTSKELTFDYFDQLVVQYRELYGPITGLYSDPRGVLVEPHTAEELPIGTLEIAAYEASPWTYDKILYVEKKGLRPVFDAVQLAERYDLAIVYGEGYPTEAVRELFLRADRSRAYRLFVLHDADPDGYTIARAMREATGRMPDYAVDVVDIGLSIDAAAALGLESEEFTRRKALPIELERRLTDLEREHFVGRQVRPGKPEHACRRVELNAFTAPQLIRYVEERFAAAGADRKLIPPSDVIRTHGAEVQSDTLRGRALDMLTGLVDVEAIARELATELGEDILGGAEGWPAQDFARTRVPDWRTVIQARVLGRLDAVSDLDERLHGRVLQAIKQAAS